MKELATMDGPSTNVFQLGMEETAKRIAKMVAEGLEKAKLPPNTKLASLGLSLSGCERKETNDQLAQTVLKAFPDMCGACAVVSDTVGPLATASEAGAGIVLIAGTGSEFYSLLYKYKLINRCFNYQSNFMV